MATAWDFIRCKVCDKKILIGNDDWYLHNGKFYCTDEDCVEVITNAKET